MTGPRGEPRGGAPGAAAGANAISVPPRRDNGGPFESLARPGNNNATADRGRASGGESSSLLNRISDTGPQGPGGQASRDFGNRGPRGNYGQGFRGGRRG